MNTTIINGVLYKLGINESNQLILIKKEKEYEGVLEFKDDKLLNLKTKKEIDINKEEIEVLQKCKKQLIISLKEFVNRIISKKERVYIFFNEGSEDLPYFPITETQFHHPLLGDKQINGMMYAIEKLTYGKVKGYNEFLLQINQCDFSEYPVFWNKEEKFSMIPLTEIMTKLENLQSGEEVAV